MRRIVAKDYERETKNKTRNHRKMTDLVENRRSEGHLRRFAFVSSTGMGVGGHRITSRASTTAANEYSCFP